MDTLPMISERIKARNIYANITFGPDILDAIIKLHGRAGWNHWVEKVASSGLFGAFSFPEENKECEPFAIDFDFTGHDFSNRDLSGLDLGMCDLSNAVLRGCNIAGTEFGIITGTDFTGCLYSKDTKFSDSTWEEEPFPIGLPEEVLLSCKYRGSPVGLKLCEVPEPEGEEKEDDTVPIKVVSAEVMSFWKGYPEPAIDALDYTTSFPHTN